MTTDPLTTAQVIVLGLGLLWLTGCSVYTLWLVYDSIRLGMYLMSAFVLLLGLGTFAFVAFASQAIVQRLPAGWQ